MYKNIYIGIYICLAIVFMGGCAEKTPKDYVVTKGYAPYNITIEDGWKKTDKMEGFVYMKTFSPDLPMSNFILQIQQLVKPDGKKYITLKGYTNYFRNKILAEHDAEVLEEKELTVNGLIAKNISFKHLVTIRELTREVYSQSIIFVIQGYVYEFSLGTFEKDYPQASKEFELMVNSFHFTK